MASLVVASIAHPVGEHPPVDGAAARPPAQPASDEAALEQVRERLKLSIMGSTIEKIVRTCRDDAAATVLEAMSEHDMLTLALP